MQKADLSIIRLFLPSRTLITVGSAPVPIKPLRVTVFCQIGKFIANRPFWTSWASHGSYTIVDKSQKFKCILAKEVLPMILLCTANIDCMSSSRPRKNTNTRSGGVNWHPLFLKRLSLWGFKAKRCYRLWIFSCRSHGRYISMELTAYAVSWCSTLDIKLLIQTSIVGIGRFRSITTTLVDVVVLHTLLVIFAPSVFIVGFKNLSNVQWVLHSQWVQLICVTSFRTESISSTSWVNALFDEGSSMVIRDCIGPQRRYFVQSPA